LLLERLTEANGVSGNEGEVRDIIRREIEGMVDEVRTDVLGNLIAIQRGDGPTVMLAAHMDEVGFIISGIEKDGLLRFEKVGGIDDRVLPSKRVVVGPDKVPGVIGLKPVHLQEPSEREEPVKADRLFVDVGAGSREEAEKKVKVGSYACFHTRFERLSEKTVKAKALDDRVGCAVLIEALRHSSDLKRRPFTLAAAFTVQEEIGLRGAGVAAWALEPDLALVLEGTICADVPGTDPHLEGTRLGDGPALSMMDRTSIASKGLLTHLVRTARDRGIPFQYKRITAGGNDAGRIHLTREGVQTASVSVPCRYIHSPCSVMSMKDFENAVRLVNAFLDSIEGGLRV